MFDLTQSEVGKWLLCAFLWGVGLGIFYDVIRAFRMLCGVSYGDVTERKKHIAARIFEYLTIFFTDIIFWLVSGVLSILLIYRMGGGIFRGITYIGLAAGFALYYFTLGNVVLKCSRFLVRFLKKAVKKMLCIMLIPAKKLFSALIALYRLTIGRILGKIIEEVRRAAQKKRQAAIAEEDKNIPDEDSGGKEEFVYVDGKIGYRKQGRINFGSNSRN